MWLLTKVVGKNKKKRRDAWGWSPEQAVQNSPSTPGLHLLPTRRHTHLNQHPQSAAARSWDVTNQPRPWQSTSCTAIMSSRRRRLWTASWTKLQRWPNRPEECWQNKTEQKHIWSCRLYGERVETPEREAGKQMGRQTRVGRENKRRSLCGGPSCGLDVQRIRRSCIGAHGFSTWFQ